VLGFKIIPDNNNRGVFRYVALAGKASYHIFLVQMVYFNFNLGRFGYLINIFVCIFIGVIFYNIEGIVRNRFRLIVNKKGGENGSYRIFNR
jgi:hypothetical protein